MPETPAPLTGPPGRSILGGVMSIRPARVLLAVILAAWAGAAAANPAQLSYQVYFGGLKALGFQAELDLSGSTYRARLNGRTEGMTNWLFAYVAQAQSEGRVVGGQLQPQRHVVESTARGNRRDTRLTFQPDGSIDSVVLPPPEDDDREPVTPAQQRGALDPISAILNAAQGLATTGSCAQRLPVFDGRRRYDLEFSDGGHETLKASDYASFSGEATLCLFRYIRIAGYQKPGSTRWSNPRDVDRVYKVWLAPIAPGLPPLPVRIEAEGTFGDLIVHWIAPGRPQG